MKGFESMKKFIVEFGRGLIDVSAWIVLIFIVLIGIVSLFTNPLAGIGIIVIGLIMFVAFYYLLYLFIDIRDLLKAIVEKDKENN